jgi:hypothetical protein
VSRWRRVRPRSALTASGRARASHAAPRDGRSRLCGTLSAGLAPWVSDGPRRGTTSGTNTGLRGCLEGIGGCSAETVDAGRRAGAPRPAAFQTSYAGSIPVARSTLDQHNVGTMIIGNGIVVPHVAPVALTSGP